LNAFSSDSSDPGEMVKWINREFYGEWIVGQTAGGCGNGNYNDFWKNPQFCVSLSLMNNQDDLVSMIVSLMQTEQSRKRAETDGTYENSLEPINFAIYKVKDTALEKFGTNKKFTSKELVEVNKRTTYMAQREITQRYFIFKVKLFFIMI
jgi:hypothetical protein